MELTPVDKSMLLMLGQLLADCAMAGIIWMVQIVTYPQFLEVPQVSRPLHESDVMGRRASHGRRAHFCNSWSLVFLGFRNSLAHRYCRPARPRCLAGHVFRSGSATCVSRRIRLERNDGARDQQRKLDSRLHLDCSSWSARVGVLLVAFLKIR